ncbi:hypothetical protein SprV_0200846400 [Sparganum proliferum]
MFQSHRLLKRSPECGATQRKRHLYHPERHRRRASLPAAGYQPLPDDPTPDASGNKYVTIVTTYSSPMTSCEEVRNNFYDDMLTSLATVTKTDKPSFFADFTAHVRSDYSISEEVDRLTWRGAVKIGEAIHEARQIAAAKVERATCKSNTETSTDDEETPDAQLPPPPPPLTPTTNPTIKFASPVSIMTMTTTTPTSFIGKNTDNALPPNIVIITTTAPTTNNLGSIPTCPRCDRTFISCSSHGHTLLHAHLRRRNSSQCRHIKSMRHIPRLPSPTTTSASNFPNHQRQHLPTSLASTAYTAHNIPPPRCSIIRDVEVTCQGS